MRQKLKQLKQRGKQYGEHEEKVCIKCRKAFTDIENYNWSCRIHTGVYNTEMYWWCCGRTGKDAIGCKVSKHVAKEEDEEDIEENKEDDKLKYATARCSSCKEVGHIAHDCPKDPNVQGIDPGEDIKRIDDIKQKKKANAANIVVNQKLMEIMALKFPGEAVGIRDVSSGSDYEDYEDDEIPENYVHDPFKDISSLQNMSFNVSENAVSIHTFTLQEEKTKEKGKFANRITFQQSESEINK